MQELNSLALIVLPKLSIAIIEEYSYIHEWAYEAIVVLVLGYHFQRRFLALH